MGFLKRFLSLGSSKSRRNKKKQNASHGKEVDAEGRILRQHELAPPDADTSANRLLRSSSTKFSVMSEIDYASLPPPPLPVGRFPSTPSLSPSPSMLTVATTPGVKRSGTYVVKVHSRTTHSRTEFPHANPLPSPTKQPRTAEPKTPRQDEYDTDEDDNVEDRPRAPRLKEVNFTPKDTSRIYALRRDPSVVSLLNMYDDNGCLDEHAFANTPPTPAPVSAEIEGRQPRPRTGSTLRQLLGEPQATFTEHTHEGDISWAERFLDERLHDDSALSSPASMALETPKDALFSDNLSPPRVAPADTTLSSIGADSSINYPTISSMEVEVSETMEDIPVKAAPAPKPVIEPKTPQRASEVFGFLNRRNTVIIKERDLPEVPKDLSPETTGISQGGTDDISTHDTSLDALHNAIHSANTSHSASNNSSDAPSHLSHAQIHTATMTKLNSAFAASTLSLNLLTSYDEGTDKPPPSEDANSIDNADVYEAQPATHTVKDHVPRNSTGASAQVHGPRHHHTGSSLSGSSTMNVPPSKIPRGPRPRPLSISRRDDMSPEEHDTRAAGAINMPSAPPSSSQPPTSRAAKREAFTAIPQRRHHRIASRSSESTSDREVEPAPTRPTDALKTPGPSHSYSRKRPAKPERRATSSGKENTPSPPRASPHAGHTPGGAFGLGFATPSRAKTFAGHLLGREDLQVPPSPASSSELSPVGQDMMNNLRKQRMRARQVERRKGFWVRE